MRTGSLASKPCRIHDLTSFEYGWIKTSLSVVSWLSQLCLCQFWWPELQVGQWFEKARQNGLMIQVGILCPDRYDLLRFLPVLWPSIVLRFWWVKILWDPQVPAMLMRRAYATGQKCRWEPWVLDWVTLQCPSTWGKLLGKADFMGISSS